MDDGGLGPLEWRIMFRGVAGFVVGQLRWYSSARLELWRGSIVRRRWFSHPGWVLSTRALIERVLAWWSI